MSVIKLENAGKVFRLKTGRKLLRDHIADQFRRNTDNNFQALKGVSFEVRASESVAIIGANGAGKSTLLSLVVGLTQPDTGKVSVEGRVAALLELGSGFHPDLTGRENVFLNAALLGYNEGQTKQIFGQIVEFAEIGSFIEEPLRSYSAGMMVRLAFSVAVHVEPSILIIDEVLGVGDVAFQQKCSRRLHSFREQGKTLLFVTHAIASVAQLCERAIWLDHGEVIRDGPVSEVIPAYLEFMNDPLKGRPERKIQPVPMPPPSSISKVRPFRESGRPRARAK